MPPDPMVKVDLHAHTWFSADSTTSPAEMIERARRAGLDRIAVTDHGSITGALEAAAHDPELVVVGEEVKCACGVHVIGLFLNELIPNRLPLQATVDRIRDQGGVVYAPHPYAYLRDPAGRAQRVLTVADVVEVFNARAFLPAWNRRAAEAAARLRLPAIAGSDSHFPWEVGRTYTEMPAFRDAASLLSGLAHARIVQARTVTPLVHVGSIASEAIRRLLGHRHGTAPRVRK